MKKCIDFFLVLMIMFNSQSVNGMIINFQSEIDNFSINNPGMNTVVNGLRIEGADITNLDGLTQIDSIVGGLTITNCPLLIDIDGVTDIKYISGDFNMSHLPSLHNVEGFDALKFIGNQISMVIMDELKVISGFDGLDDVKTLLIHGNKSLKEINGFSSLKVIQESIVFAWNDSLEVINGFDVLDSVHLFFQISNCPELVNVNAFNSFSHAGSTVDFSFLPKLESLSSFSALEYVGVYFGLTYLDKLTNLEGLNKLSFIGGDFRIIDNPSLENFKGLDKLQEIAGYLNIENLENLTSFAGLDSLKVIGNTTRVLNNTKLNNIDGLKGLLPEMIPVFTIGGSPELTECSIENFCIALEIPGNQLGFLNNGEGCNSREEVMEKCDAITSTVDIIQGIQAFPNPANGHITIDFDIDKTHIDLKIVDITGKVILSKEGITSFPMTINLTQKGTFFIHMILDDTQRMIQKFVNF